MRHSDFLWVVAIGIVFCGFIIYLTELSRKEETYKINCQALIGGWHPDIPKKYAEQCALAQRERSDR